MSAPLWRFVVTDLQSRTITLLDRLASDRKVAHVLNDTGVQEGRLPSDSPEVNRLFDDGDPYLAINNRFLYGLRRETTSDATLPYYVCRSAGIIMQLEDEAGSGNPTTHYTAYDPWQVLRSRPIRYGADKDYKQPVNGLKYRGVRGDLIVKSLLANTTVEDGNAYIDYGQTGEFTGTIEATPAIDLSLEQGTSVGDAWTKVTEQGVDIVLTPIYEPVLRPGIVAELNVYAQAGASRPAAIFAWDKPSKSLVGMSRLRDGTQMANKIEYFPQQGDGGGTIQTDAISVAKYGRYWLERFVQGESISAVAAAIAQADLARLKNGKETLKIDPAPERSPDPYREYYLGDGVQIYASDRLREAIFTEKRVFAFDLDVSDNGTESVGNLLVTSPDE